MFRAGPPVQRCEVVGSGSGLFLGYVTTGVREGGAATGSVKCSLHARPAEAGSSPGQRQGGPVGAERKNTLGDEPWTIFFSSLFFAQRWARVSGWINGTRAALTRPRPLAVWRGPGHEGLPRGRAEQASPPGTAMASAGCGGWQKSGREQEGRSMDEGPITMRAGTGQAQFVRGGSQGQFPRDFRGI